MKTPFIYNSTYSHRSVIPTKSQKELVHFFLFVSLVLFTFQVNLEASSGSAVGDDAFKTGKLRIAVLDLNTMGIPNLEAETLSNHMHEVLTRTSNVTSVSPRKISKIVKSQDFEKNRISSSEWAKETGTLLEVDRIVKGSLGKLGDNYVIDVRLFDTETGAINKSFTRAYRGEADGLILEIEKLSWDIAGVLPSPGTSAIQGGKIHYRESKPISNKWQIQNKSLSTRLFSGKSGNSAMLLGGSIVSYLVIKGVIAAVSHYNHKKSGRPEIGLPPDFPEVPPPPGN